MQLSRAIRSNCDCRCSGESGTGSRFGMVHTVVYPPRAAASVPVRMVSL